jgi:hypothetical protein
MEPVHVFSGTTWQWTVDVPEYSAANGWSLKYICTNADGAFDFSDDGTATSTVFSVNLDAATTAAFTAGSYIWQLFATDGTDTVFVSSGPLEVVADITDGSTAHDARSHVKKTLDALEAVIEDKASKDQLSHSIAGRSLTRFSPEELIKWRAKYAAYYREELVAARVAAGRGNPNIIKATFRRPI